LGVRERRRGAGASLNTDARPSCGNVFAPYEAFAKMIDRHWDGIVAYCKPENKVVLGFVEGLNNKIRVIQRRAYGLRDEEYLPSRFSLLC
jgi:transposase